MANELSVTNSGIFTKNNQQLILPGVTQLLISVNGNIYIADVMTVNNTDTTIPLGGLTSPFGVSAFKNLDPVNTIFLKIAAAGTIFMTLLPNECWPFRMGSGITAPVAISSASTPLMAYAILPP